MEVLEILPYKISKAERGRQTKRDKDRAKINKRKNKKKKLIF